MADFEEESLECPECGAPMKLRKTSKYTYKNGKPRLFYGCTRYPGCTGTHNAHPNGKPLGIPADKETRELRVKLHKELAKWWNYDNKEQRNDMYDFLKANTKNGHISMMDKDELNKLLGLLKTL